MKKKLSAALLAIMMLMNIITSGYLMPMQALAQGTEQPASTNDEAGITPTAPTAEEIAQNQAAVKEATQKVNGLFQDDKQQTIKENLVEAHINSVEPFVNKITDGAEKIALQALLVKAQQQVADRQAKLAAEKATETVKEQDKSQITETAKEQDKPQVTEVVNAPTKKKLIPKAIDQPKEIKDAITAVTAKLNNKEITNTNKEVKIGDTVSLDFKFKLDVDHEHNNGDYIKYKLPTNIFNATELIDQPIKEGSTIIATYSVKNGEVVITFTAIRTDQDQAISIQDGKFKATGTLKATANMEPDQELVFGETTSTSQEIKIPVTFIPKVDGKKLIQKTDGVLEQKTGHITWIITANENLTASKNAVVEDLLPADKLAYIGNVQVQKYKVNLDGTLTAVGTEETIAPVSTAKFNYSIDNKFAYKFTLVTQNISEVDVASEKITNTATISGSQEKGIGNITIHYGPPLEKRIVQESQDEIDWEIKINFNQKTLSAAIAEYTDTLTGGHRIKDGTLKIVPVDSAGKATGQSVEPYTLGKNADKEGFILHFTEGIKGQAYIVTYKTELIDGDGYLEEDLTIENTIKRSDQLPSITKKSKTYKQNIISKSHTIDYANKKINWTIIINKDNKKMESVTLVDSYPDNRTLSTVEDLKRDGTPIIESTTPKHGFTISLGTVEAQTKITYSTTYVSKTIGETPITNNAALTYARPDKSSNTKTAINSATVNAIQSTKNGYKQGEYHYDTRKISWQAGFNYQLNDIQGTVFEDVVGSNHKIDATSIQLQEVTFKNSNDITGTTKTIEDYTTLGVLEMTATGFKFTFKPDTPNTKAYKFIYNTIDKDKLMEKEYTNTATLTNGSETVYNETANVSVNHTDKIIVKDSPIITEGGEKLSWQIIINQGQSTLTNASIKDLPGKHQMILPETFEIYELDMNAAGYSKGKMVFDSKVTGYGKNAAGFGIEKTSDGFKVEFMPTITKAYIIKYDALYNGPSGSTTTNVATLSTSELSDHKGGETQSGVPREDTIIVTNADASATTTKVDFKIHKVDGDSGAPIKDVQFELYNKTGAIKIASGQTNSDGDLVFEELYEGTYTLKEASAPEPYDVSQSEYYSKTRIVIKAEIPTDPSKLATITKTIENVTKGACAKFEITFTGDNSYGGQEEFALYEIKNDTSEIEIKSDIKIGKDGKLVGIPTSLSKKTKYILRQKNLKLPQIEKIFTTDAKGCAVSFAIAFACPSFKIAVNGLNNTADEFVSNAVFTLTNKKNPAIKFENLTIDKSTNEISISTAIEKGNYELTQSNNIIGYKNIGEKSIVVDDSNCSTGVSITIDPSIIACTTYYIEVIGANAAFYKGSIFKLVDQTGETVTSETTSLEGLTVNTDGKLVKDDKIVGSSDLPLMAGNYQLKSTKTPVGYNAINEKVVPNAIDCKSTTTIDLVKNACAEYAIVVNTINNLSSKNYSDYISNSEFTLVSSVDSSNIITQVSIGADNKLYYFDDKSNSKIVIDKNKLVKIETYTLIQTKTAAGYKTIAPTAIEEMTECLGEVTINFAKTTEPTTPGVSCPDFHINFEGPASTTAEFKLVKIIDPKDATKDVVLAEAIKVTTEPTTKKQSLVLTDTKGDQITALEEGSYKLVQTKNQAGYFAISPKLFEVKMGECIADITISNTPIPPACYQDTVVTVIDQEGNQVIVSDKVQVTVEGKDTAVTTVNGQVVIPKESFNTTGNTTVVITLEDGRESTIIVPAIRTTCDAEALVPVLKVCEQDKKITIADREGKVEIPTKNVKVTVDGKEVSITIVDGKIVLPKDAVPTNKESVVKVMLEDGRESSTTMPKFSENCEITMIVDVDQSCKELAVTITENGKKVTDATKVKVEIIDATGQTVATKTVDASGNVVFEGKYASSNYQAKVTIGKVVKTVSITINDICAISIDVKTNACEAGSIHVTMNDEPAKGAVLTILNNNGETVSKVTTDKNGVTSYEVKYIHTNYDAYITYKGKKKDVVLINCVTKVAFTAKTDVGGETEEPINPAKPQKPITPVTPGKPSTNDGNGHKPNTNTGTIKVPSTETPGHQYNVYDENGKLVEKNVTVGADGKVNLDHLAEGKYTLVSKNGGKTIKFSVNKDGQLPQTGITSLMPTLIGFTLLLIGALVIGRKRRKIA